MGEDSAGGPGAADNPRAYTVGSVARGLQVLEIVADSPATGITLTELTRALGTSKSTAYALARTLVDAGHLRDVLPGPHYRLGMALVRLGDRASAAQPLADLVKPLLHEISRRTGMTARVAINDDGYPTFVARVDAPGNVKFHTPMGVRELPHSSAAGKVILAELSESEVDRIIGETGLPFCTRKAITSIVDLRKELEITRQRGYGIDDEEDQDGVFCISAPVHGHDGRVIGAISVTGIKFEQSVRRVTELGTILRTAAGQITAQLVGRPL